MAKTKEAKPSIPAMTIGAVLEHKVKAEKQTSHIMLARLSIGCWEGRVQDKDAARKREVDAHAVEGAATAGKKLGAGVAEHANLTKYCAGCRNAWGKYTTEWDKGRGGSRAFAPEAAPDLIMRVGELEAGYWERVKEFLRVWPTVLANRQYDLGAMFDPKDFPSPKAMARKFYWSFDPSILANPDDIRFASGISEEAASELIEASTNNVKEKYKAAANDAAAKLFKVVQSMHETMSVPHGEKGSKFNNSKLENILEVAEIMPMLNVTGDPVLAELARKAKKLATKSPGELRGDEVKRKAAAKESGDLAKAIADAFDVEVDDDE